MKYQGCSLQSAGSAVLCPWGTAPAAFAEREGEIPLQNKFPTPHCLFWESKMAHKKPRCSHSH